MNTDSEILCRLDEMGRDWPAEASVETAVLARLDESEWATGATRSRRLPRLLSRSALAAAALFAVFGMIAIWSSGTSQTLYAQVQRTLARAKSVHVIIQTIVDGKPKHAGDMWYLRDVGFRLELGPEVRIDDGQHAWRYEQGEPTAYCSNASGENAMMWNDMLGLRAQLDSDFVPAPEQDRRFGDVATECYIRNDQLAERIAPMPNGRMARPLVFVTADFELRRVEMEVLDGGEWKVASAQNWQYNVDVDRALFRPDFGAGVKIVNTDKQFNDFLLLDKAVYKETRNGLIYAVHRVERFEGGGLALLTSVRGTEETLAKYPLEHRRLGPGRIFVEPPATNWKASPQGVAFFRITLASATNDGIDAQWWIVVPRDTPPTFFDVAPGKVKVQAGVTPNGSYANAFKDGQGTIQQLSWEIELDVPTPRQLPDLSSVTDQVYRQLQMLDAVPVKHLDLGIEPDRFVEKFGSPEDVSAQEFAAAVAQHIRYWKQRDVDFQKKMRDVGQRGGQRDVDLPRE